MEEEITGADVLAVKMQENDADAKTIREYLIKLAHEAWVHMDGFSGKRPFGNSGWDLEIYHALAKAEMISAEITVYEDGFEELDSYDDAEATRLVSLAFEALYEAP